MEFIRKRKLDWMLLMAGVVVALAALYITFFNMEVLVFKTSVNDPMIVQALKSNLDKLAGEGRWNFDLSDCDRILRIASTSVKPESTIKLMSSLGFQCAELED